MPPRRKEKTPEQLQEYAERFHEAAPVGTLVRYFPVLPCSEDDFEDSAIRSAPWSMGGETVVMIDGRRGGVSVRHLALINPVKEIGGVAGLIQIYDAVRSRISGGNVSGGRGNPRRRNARV